MFDDIETFDNATRQRASLHLSVMERQSHFPHLSHKLWSAMKLTTES
jgi:hypothetical protein